MNRQFKYTSLVLSFVLCFAAMAFGQATSGSIEGTVTDPAGAIVPGATVTIVSTGSTAGFKRTVTSDSNGLFRFPQLLAGTYKVTAEGSGFKQTSKNATVNLDRDTVVNFQLEVGAIGEVVQVSDSNVTIDLSDTKIDTNISKQLIDDLPKGTSFTSLLKIAPNVRPEARDGGFQIDGASGSENVFVVDGMEVTNFRTGQLNSNNNLPFELLQEVQIKSTGFEAEYGGATGGVINVVTIGGNDTFRGNFGASFRPEKLQGDPTQFLNRYSTTGFDYFTPNRDGGNGFFPVASISGPIVKEKLWFSTIYAPQIYNTSRTINTYNTSAPTRVVTRTNTYEDNVKTEQAFVRLDAQPSSKVRMFGSFLWNPIIQDGVLPSTVDGLFGGAALTVDQYAAQGGRQNGNSVNGQVTYTPTNYLVLNFRAGRNFLNEKLNSYSLPAGTRYLCSTSGNPQNFPGSGCARGFNSGSNFTTEFDVSTRTTFDIDAGLVGINAGGRHNFKFGYQFNRLFNTVESGYKSTGYVVLYYGLAIDNIAPVAPTGSTMANPSGACSLAPAGSPCNNGSGLFQRFGTVGEASSKNQALYVQDSWTISNRLTFNMGLRIENEIVPSFGDSASTQAIEFGWGDKIAPRFGVAFDLTGDGKTKLFGSYGWFYDRFKYELPRGSFGGDFFRRDYFEILPSRGNLYTGYTLANILGGAADVIGGRCPITAPTGYSRCQFDFRIATNSIGADIFETGAVDPDLKAARQSEYTIGLERELSRNFLLSARYTHKQVDRAIEDVGVFNDQGSEAYIIGNPGIGLVCEISTSGNYPCTKAERLYDALEIRVDKRASNYFFNASYTLSRLYGNYSGLTSTDEFQRNSPNVNRFFDLPPLGYTANGVPDNGRLSTDRPHVFKAYGGYSFNWAGNGLNRTTISSFTTIQSGSPLTTIYNLYSLGTTVLSGRGDQGRTERFTETDLAISHKYKFGRDARFGLEPFVEIRNLFDENNVLTTQTTISDTNFNYSQITTGGCTTCTVLYPVGHPRAGQVNGGASELATFQRIFNGGGIEQFVRNYLASTGTQRNDFNQPNRFQNGRDVRFGFRFTF